MGQEASNANANVKEGCKGHWARLSDEDKGRQCVSREMTAGGAEEI